MPDSVSGEPPQGTLISLIVPSYRSRATIAQTLQSALDQRIGHPTEVLVVDSSDDGTADWVRQRFPQVQVHHSPRRLLPGAARNRGARLSRGSLLAFLDSDAVAPPDWLKGLLSRMEGSPQVRLAGAAVGCANPAPTAARALYWIEFSEFLPGSPSGQRSSLSSCNFLIRRVDFEMSGGFDEQFAMAEDLIFCRKFAGKLQLESGITVLHRHREEWGEVRRHLRRLGFWSGRYRAAFPAPGSSLRRLPQLSFALLPLRLWRILARVRAARPAGPQISFSDLPLLVRGLTAWCWGFCEGLKEGSGKSDGDQEGLNRTKGNQ